MSAFIFLDVRVCGYRKAICLQLRDFLNCKRLHKNLSKFFDFCA